MSLKRAAILFFLFAILIANGGCRKDEPEPADTTPIPPGTTPTAQVEPEITPTPTLAGLGIVPLGNDMPLVPRIVSQNPAPSQELALDGVIELVFDQPMDQEATTLAWQLVDDAGAVVDGDVNWPRPRVLQFKPSRNLKPNTNYSARIGEAAASATGLNLLEGLTFTFQTIGDLMVSQVSPAPGAQEVVIDSAITVIFNRPVVPLLIAEEQANLPNPLQINPDVKGQGEWLNTSVYLYRPESALAGRQRYSIRVLADVVNQISATGATMADDYEWTFTPTAPTISYLNLVDLTSSPRDNFEDLPLDQAFQVFFQQPMDPAASEAAVSLASDAGTASLQFTWDEEFLTLTFTPTRLLELGTRYTLRISDAAQDAHGGRLRQGLTWRATTVEAPAIAVTEPSDGAVQEQFSSVFRISFASPMSLESLKGKVIFTPEISGNTDGFYDRWDRRLHFFGLAPSTNYTVRILPGMADPYGNRIEQERVITFRTAPYEPMANFNFPGWMPLYRLGGTTAAWVTYRNLNRLDVGLYRLSLPQFASFSTGQFPLDFTPDAAAAVWTQTPEVAAPLNDSRQHRFDLLDSQGNSLSPGLYFITLDAPAVRHDFQHLQAQPLVLATANMTLKTTASEALIWLTDLDSGRPLAGIPVAFYADGSRPIFQGVTDNDGLVYRDDLDLDVGYQTTYYAITEDPGNQVFGVAISGWSDGVRPEDFGIYTDFYLEPGQPTVYVYTDRPIYRPGQAVSFKGIVRINDDLNYRLPDLPAVDVTVFSFNETVLEESVPLNEFGSFATEFTLDDEATLGSYYISVQAGETWIGSGSFSVAEYRKPTFQVRVTAAENDVLAGATIPLSVDAQFFSGGAVVNGQITWAAFASSHTFQAGGSLSRYSFQAEEEDRRGFFYGFYDPVSFIADGMGQTDGNGRFTVEIPAELDEEDGSRKFMIEATVTDSVGNIVSGRTEVIVHRSLVYPGIRSEQYVGQAGEEMAFDIVLLDWAQEPVPDLPVRFEVVERRWYSVQEEDEFGQIVWRTSVEEFPVFATDDLVADSQGRVSAGFVPPRGGIYRALVSVQDRLGNESAASTYVWVAADEFVTWRRVNDHSFDLIADADSYRPGDTAEILIASPFQGEATALVTVERGHIKQHEVIALTSNSTIYRLPITGEMAPNVFVSVMVIKGIDASNPAPDFKVGMVQFEVERDEQELQVEIVPDRQTAGPGDDVTYTVRVRDFQGRPVDAEVSLALVDLAALSIADPNAPPILDHFYSDRWLSVNTSLLLTRLMDTFNRELEETMKGGGGGGDEMGIISVREDFPDTAYWEAQVQTGEDGETAVTVTLPDNLTTWRMDARAVTLDTKVGQSTSDLVVTLPLLVSPFTPRFFVVGDTALLGTAVHNNTGEELEVMVRLQAEGVTLRSPESQMVTVPAGQQAVVRWEAVVGDVGRVDLVFSATGGEYADASRPTLGSLDGQGIPVYKYQVPEVVGTSGQMNEGGAIVESIGLPIFPDFELTEGKVMIEVAPSLAAAMTEGLDYLEHYPYECTEQIISRFLPNVLTTRALKEAGLSDATLEANLAEQVNIALQRLYSRQRPDGGWPWWDESRSDTLVSAYVLQALVEAQASGYSVSQGVIDRGVDFVKGNLRQVDGLDGRFKLNRQAYLVYVLARAVAPSAGEINRLYEQREALDLYARGYLAQAILLMDDQDPRLPTITADFTTAAILSATGTHWEEAELDYWNWNSDVRTTAIVLDTMIKLDPDSPLVANAVRWLMAHRTGGRWRSTQETAWTLIALTNWMVASGELEADYQYEIALNGTLRGTGVADTESLQDSWQLEVDIAELSSDELNRLAIGRSEGPGNLYYTAHLQASLPVAQVKALDRGIIISRSYFDPGDRETPVTEMRLGETFLARLTIVVPETLHFAIIEDHLPAGLEAVDTSLKTSQQISAPDRYDFDEFDTQGWGWWYFDHVELRDEKVVISADTLPAGTYEYVYLVRAAVPGEYSVIPPVAFEFYFPEVYGRGDGSMFIVRMEN